MLIDCYKLNNVPIKKDLFELGKTNNFFEIETMIYCDEKVF